MIKKVFVVLSVVTFIFGIIMVIIAFREEEKKKKLKEIVYAIFSFLTFLISIVTIFLNKPTPNDSYYVETNSIETHSNKPLENQTSSDVTKNTFQNINEYSEKEESSQSTLEHAESIDEKYLFSNVFESHEPPNDSVCNTLFYSWDYNQNSDLRGEIYSNSEYGQFVLSMSNTLAILGATNPNQIVSKIHLPINPKKNLKNLIWSGKIVTEKSTQGSPAYAKINIYIDGVKMWSSSEEVTGNTIKPVEYAIDMSEAKYEVIIETICTPLGDGLTLGFVDMNLNYK